MMTGRVRIFRTLATAYVLLASASFSFADDYLMTVGEPVAVNGHTVSAEEGDTFKLDLREYNSYSCKGVPSDGASAFGFSTEVATPQSSIVQARATGMMSPVITGGEGIAGRTRISFTPQSNGRHTLHVSTAKDGGEDVRVSCVNTSMVGGYNTFVNSYNFLEVQNHSSEQVNAYLSAVDYKNEAVIIRRPISLAPGQRVDIDLHSIVGHSSFGVLFLTHDGPIFTVSGGVSFYSGDVFEGIVFRGHKALHPVFR